MASGAHSTTQWAKPSPATIGLTLSYRRLRLKRHGRRLHSHSERHRGCAERGRLYPISCFRTSLNRTGIERAPRARLTTFFFQAEGGIRDLESWFIGGEQKPEEHPKEEQPTVPPSALPDEDILNAQSSKERIWENEAGPKTSASDP